MAANLRKTTRTRIIPTDHGTHTIHFLGVRGKCHRLQNQVSPSFFVDRYDSAMVEGLLGRMQTELLDRQSWMTYIELATAMAGRIEVFHNQQRQYSSSDVLTPTECEILKINQPQR